jgi:hypothetical protein
MKLTFTPDQTEARNQLIRALSAHSDEAVRLARAACVLADRAAARAEADRCENCGDTKPAGQSCDCFDNGCQ